ncbi:hypothetical protein Sjap_025523 [Stephania japonica]|uniref:Protein FAR1-RELATED SEQUENCE n=1 Tax=Stephania japonica TaxID=461633 RepID=A0AAP0E6A2_9MAGN
MLCKSLRFPMEAHVERRSRSCSIVVAESTKDHHHHRHRPPPLQSGRCIIDEATYVSSSDVEGSSHESLGREDNSVPLVDEVSIPNVIHEQDFNTSSHLIPTKGMSFGSLDKLLETYQDHAKEEGFAVVIRSSTKVADGQLNGLLCRHIFEVMKMKGIARVHEIYITRRWRKDVLRRHLSIVHFGGYPQMTDEYKEFKEIERALHETVDLSKNNPVRMGFLKMKMDAIIEMVKNHNGVIQVDQAKHLGNFACTQTPNHVPI